jgi:hypothetical protein
MNTDNRLKEYDERFARLNDKLRPIAERPIDTSQPDWMEKLAKAPHPLVQAGEVAEGESLRASLEQLYVSTPELREAITDLFGRYRAASWALYPVQKATGEELFRSRLLGKAMRGTDRDWRDVLVGLEKASREAASASVDIGPILESFAAISGEFVSRAMLRIARDGFQFPPDDLL